MCFDKFLNGRNWQREGHLGRRTWPQTCGIMAQDLVLYSITHAPLQWNVLVGLSLQARPSPISWQCRPVRWHCTFREGSDHTFKSVSYTKKQWFLQHAQGWFGEEVLFQKRNVMISTDSLGWFLWNTCALLSRTPQSQLQSQLIGTLEGVMIAARKP